MPPQHEHHFWCPNSGVQFIEQALRKDRRSPAGRKPYEPLLMFKVLILQALYNMPDEDAEDIIDERLTFRRFVGLENSRKAPDATTIWRFREALAQAGVIQDLSCSIPFTGIWPDRASRR